MKNVFIAVCTVGILSATSGLAEVFHMKNNSDRTITISFNAEAWRALGNMVIAPGKEQKVDNVNVPLITDMTVRYCDGPMDTSCACEQDEFANTMCSDYKNAFYSVKFAPNYDRKGRDFYLKFDLEGKGSIGRKPMVQAQKGRFGKLSSISKRNIKNADITEVELSHVKALNP